MGSDQSSQHGRSKGRLKSTKRSQSNDGSSRGGGDRRVLSSSPRPSICSDSDIPYTSYVRTPSVSEDLPDRKLRWNDLKPKVRDKHINREKRDNKSKSVGSLVIVKAAAEIPTVEKDPLYQRLLEIPPFVPIIRGSLKIPWTKDPDITEKIDQNSFIRIGLFYEERMTSYAQRIQTDQTHLLVRVTEVEEKLKQIMKCYGDHQRRFGKYAEKFCRITELSNSLTKCHEHLNKALESIEILNNLLPKEDRLEPFVWTTG